MIKKQTNKKNIFCNSLVLDQTVAIKHIVIICALVITAIFVIVIFVRKETVCVKGFVTHEMRNNAALTGITKEEFMKKGFCLGDSCDVVFENGYSLKDVPFYNGYYVKDTEPIIVAYPNVSEIIVTLDNIGIWDVASLKDGEKVEINLNTAGKYVKVQNCLNLLYSKDRTDYENDIVFCNFRALKGGKLKKDFFWRGASPVDDKYKRATLTDRLIAEKGIRYEMNLADSKEEMEAHLKKRGNESPYARELYKNGMTATMGLNANFRSIEHRYAVVDGLRQMMKAEGPVYIHCTEGKDRTGFICMILEALAGASYDEMLNDYMITYSNYYAVDKKSSPERYKMIADTYFDDYICCLKESENMGEDRGIDYAKYAENYLISGGMTGNEIEMLKKYLTKI